MLQIENLAAQTEEFGKKFIAPRTAEIDQKAEFPSDIFAELKKQGFTALFAPKEFGGFGGGAFEHIVVCYNLARFDASVALCYMMHNVATSGLRKYGTQEQKEKILSKVAKGEVMIALAYSESGTGTHFGSPDIVESEKNGKRVLKGRKSFVTTAKYANYYLTLTNSVKEKGKMNNWLTPSDHSALKHEEGVWNGLGMRGNVSVPVQYNDVELDEFYRLGNEGSGLDLALDITNYFVAGLGAVYSGLGRAAYECALNHCKERKYTSGQSLADIESVRNHLADLYTKTASSYALVEQAARAFDNGEKDAGSKVFACRINATQNVMDICMLAMRLGGGKAYSKLLPLERYLRDSLAAQVMAPSLDVLKTWLAGAII